MIRIAVPPRLTPATLELLLEQLEGSDAPRLLTGNGDGFCAGMDLATAMEEDARRALQVFRQVVLALRSAASVAVVAGAARGGGVGLAAACDIVVATPQARFALPELLFGLVPGAILPLLRERLTPHSVRRLGLMGGSVDAHEALRLGLVDEIVGDERDGEAWLRRLARAEPHAAGVLRRLSNPSLARAMASGEAETLACLARPEARGRMRRFLEGELPWPPN